MTTHRQRQAILDLVTIALDIELLDDTQIVDTLTEGLLEDEESFSQEDRDRFNAAVEDLARIQELEQEIRIFLVDHAYENKLPEPSVSKRRNGSGWTSERQQLFVDLLMASKGATPKHRLTHARVHPDDVIAATLGVSASNLAATEARIVLGIA